MTYCPLENQQFDTFSTIQNTNKRKMLKDPEFGSCNDTTQIMLNFLYLADRKNTVYIKRSEL